MMKHRSLRLVLGVITCAAVAVASSADPPVLEMGESPRGQPCCEFPHVVQKLLPLNETTMGKCRFFCPWVNEQQLWVGEGEVKLCFRGAQKAGTSVTLLALHDAIPQILETIGYSVELGNMAEQSWGFMATLNRNTRTAKVEAGREGQFYKHGSGVEDILGCRLVLNMRDPRDSALSLFHHHRPGARIPEHWWAPDDPEEPAAHFPLDQMVSKAARFTHLFAGNRDIFNGLLVLDFATVTQNLAATLLQVAEFADIDVYADATGTALRPGINTILRNVEATYSKARALDLLAAKNATTEQVLKGHASGTGWLHRTHFNGGEVGRYKKEISPGDVRLVDKMLCKKFPITAGLYGAQGCSFNPKVHDKKVTKFPRRYTHNMERRLAEAKRVAALKQEPQQRLRR